MVGNQLELVTPAGCVRASATVAPSSVQNCAETLPAVELPPVSASATAVYFRDGDTQIKSLTPDGAISDVTSVPGGPNTISSFAVSPDGKRIAVVVEDLSAPQSIAEQLYVEDLTGANHIALYSTSIPKGKGGLAMFAVGWHNGAIVLAMALGCSTAPVTMPAEWHVVSATNADRLGSVPGTKIRCLGSLWQSPDGVACAIDNTTFVMTWSGKQLARVTRGIGPESAALSPSGRRVAMAWGHYPYANPLAPATEALNWGESDSVLVKGGAACEWIDDVTMLTPGAVIAYPSGTVTSLPATGQCAGRFPGGL